MTTFCAAADEKRLTSLSALWLSAPSSLALRLGYLLHLLRGIDHDPTRQTIVRHSLALLAELQITPLAEGVETREEMACLREMGVSLMQGYLFARPGFETLPEVDFASL